MNLNYLAKEITKSEGLKTSVNVAQVKEVMKHLAVALAVNSNWIADMVRLGNKHLKFMNRKSKGKAA